MRRRTRRVLRHAVWAAAVTCSAGIPAHSEAASLQPQDLDVLGKAVSYVDPPPAAGTAVAIVYAAGDAASRRDAEDLAAEIGAGLPTAAGRLRPVVMDGAALAESHPGLVITAQGVTSGSLGAALRTLHVLCVTGDVALVQSGDCTMAIRSAGRIEIFINPEAAKASELRFTTAFRMMVHEL